MCCISCHSARVSHCWMFQVLGLITDSTVLKANASFDGIINTDLTADVIVTQSLSAIFSSDKDLRRCVVVALVALGCLLVGCDAFRCPSESSESSCDSPVCCLHYCIVFWQDIESGQTYKASARDNLQGPWYLQRGFACTSFGLSVAWTFHECEMPARRAGLGKRSKESHERHRDDGLHTRRWVV